MRFHPASLLLAWGCMVVLLQRLPFESLLPISLSAVAVACLLAKPLFLSMLRRTRWLFLTLFVLFSTMTPGVFVPAPWSLGIVTQEGLFAAAEHLLRLAAMLALVAILLDTLEQRAIVAGLFLLLRPFDACGIDCERISVRLLLVLDQVAADRSGWRQLLRQPILGTGTTSICLHVAPLQSRDVVLGGVAAVAMILGLLW